MFRKEFADVIGKTGMIPVKDIRDLLLNKDPHTITEFNLLNFDFFDDIRFAKTLSEKFNLTFIDLSRAKINDNVISLVKKTDAIKYRCIPIQKTAKAVTLAIFDPSIEKLKSNYKPYFSTTLSLF